MLKHITKVAVLTITMLAILFVNPTISNYSQTNSKIESVSPQLETYKPTFVAKITSKKDDRAKILKKFFAFGSLFRRGPSGLIDIFVGILELISEFVRIVSFTFRLFGNMTAGEILIIMITFLVPFVVTNLVFGLELLVGLIQAVIFAGLTLVFLSLAIKHEEH